MTRYILHPQLTTTCIVLVGLSLVAIVATPGNADDSHSPRILTKRQSQPAKPQQAAKPTLAVSSNGLQSTSMAMSSVSSGATDNKVTSKLPANMDDIEDDGPDQTPEEVVERRPVNRRRRPKPRPQPKENRRDRYEYQDEYQDEDCDDDEYDEYGAGNLFHSMAARPMRQFSRMMGHMFDQMQGMSSEMMYNNRPGGSFSSASASSVGSDDDDGYSRSSAIVNNNGRSRGIISETRNGRTKTQRIGDD